MHLSTVEGVVKRSVLVIAINCILIFWGCHPGKKQDKPELPYKGLEDSARYVGITVCKQCHSDVYNTFIETGMGQSFDKATHTKSSAVFDNHAWVYDKYRDFYYRPFWKGDSLYISEYRLKGNDTVYRRTERAEYVIGSGQHTNSHMMLANGYLYQLPMTFYTQKKQWDLPPGFEGGGNSRFNREMGLECLSCHNSLPDFVKGSENKYSKIPNGINCERCHGPGSIHVKEKSSGHLIDINKEIDYSIVNPAKLPVDLQFEICQRCHLQGNAVLNENKSFYDFKPGMRLSSVMNVFSPVFKGAENEYIMASHVERLKMSRCFTETMKAVKNGSIKITDPLRPYKNALTCVTCHNPHVSVKVTGTEVFNAACRKCHEGTGNKVCTRSRNDPHETPVTGNCVGCHMPKSNTIDIPHVITTDHYIRKPVSDKHIKRIKEFLGVKCVNNPNPEKWVIGRAYLQYYEKFNPLEQCLDSAEKYLVPAKKALNPLELNNVIYLYHVKNQSEKIVQMVTEAGGYREISKGQHQSYGNEHAWLDYRIAEAYNKVGNTSEAEKFMSLAVQLAPYVAEFKSKLGNIYASQNRLDQAIALYEDIIKENSRFVSAFSNLGYLCLLRNGDTDRAGLLYNQALALDPDNEQALVNKAGLLFHLKKFSEAKMLLQHLLEKHPKNEQGRQLLISLKSLNGKNG